MVAAVVSVCFTGNTRETLCTSSCHHVVTTVQQLLFIVANQRSAEEVFNGECKNAPADRMLGQVEALSILRTSREESGLQYF